MMLRTHLVFGFLIGLLSLNYLNIPNVYVFLILVCVSAVIADIDNSNSKIGRKIKTVSWTIEKLFGHRNLFHSIFPLITIFIIFFFLLKWNVVGMAILLGYGSHIFIDAFTYMGIGLFHPIYNKRISGFIKTGGIVEYLIFFLILIADIAILINYLFIS